MKNMCNLTIERYIPENSTEEKFDDIEFVVYSYEKDNTPIAIAYKGKSKKPHFHYRFQSVELRAAYIAGAAKEIREVKQSREKFKKEQKERETQESKNIKVDDIFIASWGYEQTNIDAYQVVSRTKNTVKLREIATRTVKDHGYVSADVEPVKDSFRSESIITKRLRGASVSFDHCTASLHVPGKTYTRSWYA